MNHLSRHCFALRPPSEIWQNLAPFPPRLAPDLLTSRPPAGTGQSERAWRRARCETAAETQRASSRSHARAPPWRAALRLTARSTVPRLHGRAEEGMLRKHSTARAGWPGAVDMQRPTLCVKLKGHKARHDAGERRKGWKRRHGFHPGRKPGAKGGSCRNEGGISACMKNG